MAFHCCSSSDNPKYNKDKNYKSDIEGCIFTITYTLHVFKLLLLMRIQSFLKVENQSIEIQDKDGFFEKDVEILKQIMECKEWPPQ